jgi:uncharacterized protein
MSDLVATESSSPGKSPLLDAAVDVTVVLIVSTLCNLRCKYCYEYPDLANRHHMSLDELERVFGEVARHYAGSTSRHVRFAWQGGEPLLLAPDYYRAALERQRRAFGTSALSVSNVIQTNLTVLDTARVALLVECFDGVGVSHDVVGDLRVDAGGRSRTRAVEANLDTLIRAGVPLGGISVLNRQNAAHVREIYDFWQARGLPFRLLPMHRGPFPSLGEAGLDAEQVHRALAQCVDLWLSDTGRPKPVAPITDMIHAVVRARTRPEPSASGDRRDAAQIHIVNPRGFVGGVNDLLDLEHAYGNVFEQSLSLILEGEKSGRALARANAEVGRTCTTCPYFRRACDGHPVADGGKELWRRDASGAIVCVVQRKTLAHIERRLRDAGLFDEEPAHDDAAALTLAS